MPSISASEMEKILEVNAKAAEIYTIVSNQYEKLSKDIIEIKDCSSDGHEVLEKNISSIINNQQNYLKLQKETIKI